MCTEWMHQGVIVVLNFYLKLHSMVMLKGRMVPSTLKAAFCGTTDPAYGALSLKSAFFGTTHLVHGQSILKATFCGTTDPLNGIFSFKSAFCGTICPVTLLIQPKHFVLQTVKWQV